jgi:hypothetical protein
MLDAYNRRARLAPAALAALPAIVLLGTGLVDPVHAASVLAMALGGVGILICGLVRDAGRRQQSQLWRDWGGSPTLRQLRWRASSDASAVERLHCRVESVTKEALPSLAEETADPEAADRRYNEATAAVRELTRPRKEFPLVFEENVEYGFRRNCLGVRPVALTVALSVVAVGVILVVAGDESTRFWAAAGVGAVASVGWLRLVTPDWVRSAGEIYADRLFEALASLTRDAPPS